MDDGNSWIGILLLGTAFVIYYLIYGFGAAVQAGTDEIQGANPELKALAEQLQQSAAEIIRRLETAQG